jgi:beta-lactamase class A
MNRWQSTARVLSALVALLAFGPGTRAEQELPLPPTATESARQPLHQRVDPVLQAELKQALDENQLWRRLVASEKMAVGVVDLSDPDRPRFARVNGRTMMYAASLPKIAVLLAAFVSFEDGTLDETPEIHRDLVAMIRVSSNAAATRMIDRIGFEKIAAVLMDPQYGFYNKELGGGLWVGKRYAKAGGRHPDPIRGLSHAASVTEVCRFYYLLANGRIISPERSREMLEILADPDIHHKFVCMIEERAPDARMFRKSGTWKKWHCDSVLVWGRVWRHYILVALVEHELGEQILRDLVPVVESLLEPSRGGSRDSKDKRSGSPG